MAPVALKKLIDASQLVGEGVYGSVFRYQDRLIKLDKILYHLLKEHDVNESEKIIYYRYTGGRENFNNPLQIEQLCHLQKNVKLTKLPTGIVTLCNVDYQNIGLCAGILIPYLKGYTMLENLPKNDLKRVLIILKKLLLEVRELEENGIYQEDMFHFDGKGGTCYNIMYSNDTPTIIDMSGDYVVIGGNEHDRSAMYDELGQVIIDFLDYNGVISPYRRWYTNDYEKNCELVKAFERSIK